MGGQIHLESEIGKGSIFSFEIELEVFPDSNIVCFRVIKEDENTSNEGLQNKGTKSNNRNGTNKNTYIKEEQKTRKK